MLLPLIAYSLIWKPSMGDSVKQSLRFELHFDDEDVLYTADLTSKVETVSSDGTYVLRTDSANAKMVVGSKEIAEEPSKAIRETYDAQGRRVSIDDFGDTYSNMMGTITEFYPPDAPVEFGVSWTHQITADPLTSRSLTFMDYKLVGEEAGNLRVDFKYKQVVMEGDPVTASGKFLLDRTNFALVGYEGTAENVREGDDFAPGRIVVTLKPR
jgi:hypothetical protein